jgi:proline iminopeptidase
MNLTDSRHTVTSRGRPATRRTALGAAGLTLRVILVVLFANVAGLIVAVGAAAISARPVVFLAAGMLAVLATAAGGSALATRKAADRHRRTWLLVSTTGAVAIFAVAVLAPLGDPRQPPTPVAGQRFWQLSTGSRVAYVHLAAAGARRPAPVVILHGGPGIPDMRGDAGFFGQLTLDGFDVWVYDQVGAGRSDRSADPRAYTINRQVADLEAIRRQIGADRLMLVGHSWGGQVAANYLAAHPDHVARVVFSSPGALAPQLDDGSQGGVKGRLTVRQQLGLYRLLLQPRALLAWTLLQVNPVAAHAYAGDPEMDARTDRVYNAGRAGAHCGDLPSGPPLHGLGFYAWYYPGSAGAGPAPDPRAALERLSTPALVIKGSCDYLSWASGTAYRRALPNARLVYLHHAGHNAYQDQPAGYLAVVRAFLTDRPLTVPPWTGGVPADYQGPAGRLPA